MTPEKTYDACSPEALTYDEWLKYLRSLGVRALEYVQHLLETNGSTAPPPGRIVIWGLRSNASGRWIGNGWDGVEALQVFRTRELAERTQIPGNSVVWLHPLAWWRKVEDAAKTGYPPEVFVLRDIVNGQTQEATYQCKDLAASPIALIVFLRKLFEQDYNEHHAVLDDVRPDSVEGPSIILEILEALAEKQ